MSRFVNRLKNYFDFSDKEIKGISVLLLIIIIVLLFPYVLRTFNSNNYHNNIYKINNISIPRNNDTIAKRYNQKPYIITGTERFTVELNSADSLELMRLYGIGSVFASRIINYRKVLGGYYHKSQLLEVWGMDSIRYNAIKDKIIVNKDSIHKININDVAFKKLMKHPYFDYELSRWIIEYKRKYGNFNSEIDLMNFKDMTPDLFNRIKHYVKFN